MSLSAIISKLESLIFWRRGVVIALFVLATVFMGYSASQLHIDAGFKKLLPMEHEYMQTYKDHGKAFGGANRLVISMMAKEGDIFTPEFFEALQAATEEVFFINGVDRSRVRSLFTPNVRYTEVVEGGISAGNVVPADFQPTPEGLAQVRENVIKAGIVGKLVAKDFSGTIISANLMDTDPDTGERLDYLQVSKDLEEKVRDRFQNGNIDVHIIGFAKVIGDMVEGASRVVIFFGVAFLITAFMVYAYSMSIRHTVAVLATATVSVIWQIGLLPVLGLGIDPMGILVPFLVFAIAVSHGVQMVSATGAEIFDGADGLTAARTSFRRLAIPGITALATDTIGFVTIWLIPVRIIQEVALIASLGVAVIIVTNLVLLPVLLSYVSPREVYRGKLQRRARHLEPIWRTLSLVAERKHAAMVILLAVALAAFGVWKAPGVKIGDLHRGVPEFRQDSRYNRDMDVITTKFSLGVDSLSVIAETKENGCVDSAVMDDIDAFTWHMRNVPGVQTVVSLPLVAKRTNAAWHEGSLKWQALPVDENGLNTATRWTKTDSGLLNSDCSVMPVVMYTADHKADTIARIVSEVKDYLAANPSERVKFRLATGNVGVMAATNEEVDATQFRILLYVFGAVIVFCFFAFRSVKAVLIILLPLGLVSLLGYALMTMLEIGLKVNTLPVVALGVGVGVDYGIYIYGRLKSILDEGKSLRRAYELTLDITGNGVLLTGVTLGIGVATWIFSPLKFQADMGILLTFLFLMNMVGAVFLLPALACWLLPSNQRAGTGSEEETDPTAANG